MNIEKDANNIKLNSICKFVEKSIIPIIVCLEDEKTGKYKSGIHGTGTLFKFLDKYFIISAAHVLSPLDKRYENKIGIPIAKNKPEVITLNNCIISTPFDNEICNKYDYGIIELSTYYGKDLEENYIFLNEDNISFKIYDKMNIYISGYPASWTYFDDNTNILHTVPFKLMSRRKTPQKNYPEYDQNAHIMVEYNDSYYFGTDIKNKIIAEQDLGGISGCSIWADEDYSKEFWCPKNNLKIIGIQTGFMKAEYIKGTKWIFLAEAFKHYDENIYKLLFECREKQSVRCFKELKQS